jgi:hypothetical protein
MTFAFDLISDLHVETWDSFDWTDQPTSPYCVVAGDVGKDQRRVAKTLEHLGQCYAGVFYIDGNDEHRDFLEDLGSSYKSLKQHLSKLNDVVYLQNNVVIINGVAILATNGWWDYNFAGLHPSSEAKQWYCDYTQSSHEAADTVAGISHHDSTYLSNSVKKLQTHKEVKSIVIVTHTLPAPWICSHEIGLSSHARVESMGNKNLQECLKQDTENKIRTWAFGHYHGSVDQNVNNIRYVSNPRGRGNTPWSQIAYYPKRIEVEI